MAQAARSGPASGASRRESLPEGPPTSAGGCSFAPFLSLTTCAGRGFIPEAESRDACSTAVVPGRRRSAPPWFRRSERSRRDELPPAFGSRERRQEEPHMHGQSEFYTAEEIRQRRSISTLVFWKARPVGEGTLGELARHVEGADAAIAVENFPAPGLWVQDRAAFLDRIDHPQAGMIGHPAVGRGVPYAARDRLCGQLQLRTERRAGAQRHDTDDGSSARAHRRPGKGSRGPVGSRGEADRPRGRPAAERGAET